MSRQPPEEAARPDVLALPRPNPGPEPWSDDAGGMGWLLFALAVVVAALAGWAWHRRRGASPAAPRVAEDAPPEDRLLALCDGLRARLVARLGPALRARTTEELAADPRVAELFGDDLPRLVEILAEGDRLKFARRPSADLAGRLPGWTAWAESRRWR